MCLRLGGQAIAAVGQCRLIALWDELFKQLRQPVAQILLTRNDIADVRILILILCRRSLPTYANYRQFDLSTANTIPKRSKYVCGIAPYGSHSDRE